MLATLTVTNTNDDGQPGSLRYAIIVSNATTGPNLINFDIASSGVQTIAITSPLPTITVPVTIDGLTEPGNTGTPNIELNGIATGGGVDGLDVAAGQSTIEGLTINRFNGAGIRLSVAGGDTLQDNFVGTNPAGTLAEGNGYDGVLV